MRVAPVVRLSFAGRMVCELAITAWGDPQQPYEGAPHHADVSESYGRSHLLEPFLGAFELTTRCLHARLKHTVTVSCPPLE
jgi:hypothetical protein